MRSHPCERCTSERTSWLAAGLIAVGVALRILVYWRAPSLWEDELYLAVNIAQRDFRDLWRPMSFCQAGPLGFLWLERAAIGLFGVSERSIRLPSLLFGLALLPAVWRIARRIVGEWPALAALALVTFSPNLIRYSSEGKPYGIDALVSIGLISVACFWEPNLTGVTWILALVLGIGAISISNASIFALAAVGVACGIRLLRRRTRLAEWAAWAAIGATWALAFVAAYRLSRNLEEDMGACVARVFEPMKLGQQPNLISVANLAGRGFLCPLLGLDDRMPTALYVAGLVLLAIGAAKILRDKEWRSKATMLLPLGFVLLACLLGKWFFVVRLMMFAAPMISILLAAGAAGSAEWFAGQRRQRAVLILTSAALLIFPLKGAQYRARHPELLAMREGVQFALHQARPGDVIYLYSKAVPAWMFYTADWHAPDRQSLGWFSQSSRATGVGAGNVGPRGHPVEQEGWDLHRPYREGWILVGEPEGIYRTAAGPESNPPDPGWVENEYGRVMQDSKGRAILVGLSFTPRSFSLLLDRFQRAGAHRVAEYSGQGAWVVVLETPLPDAATSL